MLTRGVASLSLALLLGAPWLGCVGDDPASAPLAPADGGGGNGSVDAQVSEGFDAEAGATDAGTDAASDAAALRCGLSETAGVACPDAPCADAVDVCCLDQTTGARSCEPSCPDDQRRFECDSPDTCGSGTVCCVAIVSEQDGAACTRRAELRYSYCELSSCGGRLACRKDADCTGAENRCVVTEVQLAPGVVQVWGLCAR